MSETKKYTVDPAQNETVSGYTFGYIFVGEGGLFFTWKYDPDATHYDQVRQVVQTMEEDTTDPPTGQWSWRAAERALRHYIARNGLYPIPHPHSGCEVIEHDFTNS